jgi:hypothetical protein
MRNLLLFIALVAATISNAQKFEALDESPMDMVYFPDNFSHDRKFDPKKINGLPAIIKVIYSRPAKKDRVVFGKLVPYEKVWRAGANEATEIKFYQDVTIDNKVISAGTYTLFVIPNEKEWIIIFNKDLDHWGDYSYTEANDILRVAVPTKNVSKVIENFSIKFEMGKEKEALMLLGWDNTVVVLPIQY